jgi:hypothetical protein
MSLIRVAIGVDYRDLDAVHEADLQPPLALLMRLLNDPAATSGATLLLA